jgi:hypothetical protein
MTEEGAHAVADPAIDYAALARALMAEGLPARVAAELKPHLAAAAELLTRDELARALRVSPQTVDRRTREGMPVVYVGDLPRFDLAKCREWFANEGAQKRGAPAPLSGDAMLRTITPRSRGKG